MHSKQLDGRRMWMWSVVFWTNYLKRIKLEGGILYPEISQFVIHLLFQFLITYLPGYLKFVFLFGLLTLEGAQQAVAGSDFISGLQSMSFSRGPRAQVLFQLGKSSFNIHDRYTLKRQDAYRKKRARQLFLFTFLGPGISWNSKGLLGVHFWIWVEVVFAGHVLHHLKHKWILFVASWLGFFHSICSLIGIAWWH